MAKKAPKKRSPEEESIIPQAKILRVFRLISLLKASRFTIPQLAQRLDMNRRSIYRYIKLLEAIDFNVDSDFQGRYFIFTSDDEPGSTQFSVDETHLLNQLIRTGVRRNPLKASLLKKLSLNSEMDKMPQLILNARNVKLVEQLSLGIKEKKQVILTNYHSANSSDVRDRLIEPISFGADYLSVLALDTRDKTCKQFKMDRIGEVVIHSELFQHEKFHHDEKPDIFGMNGPTSTIVTLRLKMRAYLLLREEFPASIPYLEKLEEGDYQFYGPVKSLEGVSRFVMGLAGDIGIEGPKELVSFVKEKARGLI